MKQILRYLLTILVTLAVASCKSSSPSGRLLDSPLLKHLPENMVGFAIFDGTSSAAKRLQASSWGKNSGTSSELMVSIFGSDPSLSEAMEYTKALDDYKNKIEESLMLITKETSSNPFGFSAIMRVESSTAAKEMVDLMVKMVGTTNSSAEKVTLGDKQAHLIKSPKTQGQVYLLNEDALLIIASTQELAQRILSPSSESPTFIEKLKSDEKFKNAKSKAKVNKDTTVFGYADGLKLTELANLFTQNQPQAPNLSSLEGASFVYSRSFDDGLSDTAALVNDKPFTTVSGKKLKDLTNSKSLLATAAKNSMGYLSVAGVLLQTAIEELNKQGQATPLPPGLMNVDSLGIGVSPSSGQSLFPDAYGVINTKEAASLASALKTALTGATQKQALPTSQWSTKEIQGIQTEFMVSLIGIGLYIAPTKDRLLIGTSETAMTTAISVVTGSQKSISEGLSKQAAQVAEQGNGLIAGYINFESVYETVMALQGSMAMFSGGTPPSLDEFKELKNYGEVTFNAYVQEDHIAFNSRVDLPKG